MKRLGAYELRGELARGAMGVVFRAHDPALDRLLAVKVIRSEDVRDHESQQRFLREVRILAKLRHPHVIGVHSAGMSDVGYPFVAMDLIEGGSLRDRLASGGPLPIDDAVRLTLQLTEALSYAHERGVLHRDVKPHNILLDGDDAVLTDFGLAKILDTDAEGLTQSGDRIGTPAYMAPEQVLGQNELVGPATDVYALGVTLFEMLTKQRPHAGASVVEVFERIRSHPPSSVRQFRPTVDEGLQRIVARCLEKKVEDRYPTAEALRTALLTWRRATDPGAEPDDGADEVAERSPSRLRRALPVALLLALGVGIGLAGAGSVERAVRRDVASSELSPELEAQMYRGVERFLRDDFVGAIEDLDAVVAAEPNCSSAWYRRARARHACKRSAEAQTDLDQAIEIDPEFADAYSLRAQVRQITKTDGALADCDKAIALDPLNATYFHNRAALHYKADRDAPALADIKRSIELDPRFGKAYLLRGILQKRAQDEVGALATWGEGIRVDPKEADLYNSRGVLRSKRGDNAGAVADFTAALSAVLETNLYHLNRASAFEAKGDVLRALADVEAGLEIDPKSEQGFRKRAMLRLKLRRWSDGADDWERAAKLRDEGDDERTKLLEVVEKLRAAIRRGRYNVIPDSLEMRVGPGKGYRVMADLRKGGALQLLNEEDGWAKIEVTSQTGARYQGFVPAESIALVIDGIDKD